MNCLEFRIPNLPKTPNSLLRKHWTYIKKEKDLFHRLVRLFCRYKGDPLPKAKLTLTRCSVREPDFDNLASSFKFVIDGLVKSGVLLDDKVSCIGESKYQWEKAKKRTDQGIRIKIEWD